MTDKDFTYIGVVLDRSGSMSTLVEDMQGGFDSFIEDQKALPGRAVVSLHQFSNAYETVYFARDIQTVPNLEMRTFGGTALLDAVGRTITDTGKYLASIPENERPGNVVIIVMTDGEENSSREFTNPKIKKMIETQESKYSWKFIYLGANQDAFTTGQQYGYSGGSSITWGTSGQSIGNTYSNLSQSVSRGRVAASAGLESSIVMDSYNFTDAERASSNVDDSDGDA